MKSRAEHAEKELREKDEKDLKTLSEGAYFRG